MPTVEIKDYNILIDNKSFFDIPIKNKEEAYEKTMEMSKNNDYATDNLVVYVYFSKHYRLVIIDLSNQIEFERLMQHIRIILLEGFIEMIEQQCFLSSRKQKKQLL